MLEQAHAQTERLTRLVTYLLDLSRIEAGASALNVGTIAVGDFLENCAEDLSMVDAAKDLHYVVDVTPEDLTIEGDAERLVRRAAQGLAERRFRAEARVQGGQVAAFGL